MVTDKAKIDAIKRMIETLETERDVAKVIGIVCSYIRQYEEACGESAFYGNIDKIKDSLEQAVVIAKHFAHDGE